MPKVS
ncbi:uncharacterized protein FPRN_09847 [Fusarium proliferatum]